MTKSNLIIRNRLLRISAILCIVINISLLISMPIKAATDGSCGLNLSFRLYKTTGELVISGSGRMTDYAYNSYPLWYSDRSYIKKVTFNGEVRSIGNYAFYGCSNLKTISIPDSVTSIGICSFAECGLSSITIPDSVVSLGSSAFSNCTDLSSGVTLSKSLTSLSSCLFQGCKKLPSVKIPYGINIIEGSAFNGCYGLSSIDIPNTVTTIEKKAFKDCIELTNITIPDSVTTIANGAFEGSYINSITIPSNVTSMGSGIFKNCIKLSKVIMNNNITNIPGGTFWNCAKLSEVQFPDEVTSIGASAFTGSGISDVTIPDSVSSIEGNAFCDCKNLSSIKLPDKITVINDNLFMNCSNLNEIIIPNKVKSIGEDAFSSCYRLRSIELPRTLKSVGYNAFYDCPAISNVYYRGTPSEWNNISMSSGNTDLTNAVINYPNVANKIILDKTAASLVKNEKIIVNATVLPEDAINNTISWSSSDENVATVDSSGMITGVSQGSTIITATEKESGIYATCQISVSNGGMISSTTKWLLSDDGVLTLSGQGEINMYTFLDNVSVPWDSQKEKIKRIIVEEGITGIIDSYAFADCINAESAVLPNTMRNLGEYGFFRNCKSLKSVNIPSAISYIPHDIFWNCTNLTHITIPDSVTYIGMRCFGGTSITDINIPASVDNIEWYAFDNCANLKSITVDENNKNYSAENGILFNKDKTTLLKYPAGRTGDEYVIPQTIKSLAPDVFDSSKLNNVIIPFGIEQIPDDAFSNCEDLNSITIPGSISQICWRAFENCNTLSNVYFKGTEEQWSKINIEIQNEALINANVIYEPVFSEQIQLGQNNIELLTNEKLQLTATILPENTSDKTVIWTSSNESIATVSDGTITAVSKGSAIITATAKDSGLSAMCRVTVLNGGKISDNITWLIKDDNLMITGIGAEMNYSSTSEIPWYSDRLNIKKIIVNDGITSLGSKAFYGCINAESIEIPESVTYISDTAFVNCDELSIHSYLNSYAIQYAKNNNIPYIIINSPVGELKPLNVEYSSNSKNYYFDVTIEDYSDNGVVYVGLYGNDDVLLDLKSTALVDGDITSLSIDKNKYASYAKAFVWEKNSLKPITLYKKIDIVN